MDSNVTTSGSTEISTKPNTQLDEFLQVSRPWKGPSWANEPPPAVVSNAKPVQLDEQDVQDHRVADEPISDLEWMKRHMTQKISEPDKVFEQDDEVEKDTAPLQDNDNDPAKETILRTARLFLRNLAFSCTDAEVGELFSPFGEIEQVSILVRSSCTIPVHDDIQSRDIRFQRNMMITWEIDSRKYLNHHS